MEKITDQTKVGVNGFCYSYRNHTILITPALGYLHGRIEYNNHLIDEGFCGHGLKTAINRINARIDRDLD